MFNKKKKVEHSHSFYVLNTFEDGEVLFQLLQCRKCRKKFWGVGGDYGHPTWVHEITKKPNPLTTSSF